MIKEKILVNLQLFGEGDPLPENPDLNKEIPPVVPEVAQELTPTPPSYEELLLKMEQTSKIQLEQVKKEYEEKLNVLAAQIEEEKLKQMNDAQKEEYRKRLEYEKSVSEKESLVNKIQQLEKEKEEIKNKEYIAKLKAEKPFLSEQLDKMSIKNQQEYELYLKPIENNFKELYDYKKLNDDGNSNILGDYNGIIRKKQQPNVEVEAKINSIMNGFIDSIIRK